MGGSNPLARVGIVIATYNWSEALACALRSVRLQTFTDYQVFVMGDCCTDDSAAVVEAMGDPRFRWINRETNAGSQWAPNNDGIARCDSQYIAYLGHDDLWYPTHLDSLVRAAEEKQADVAFGITMMYGPEGSGVRTVCGVLVDGQMDEGQFVVPSSILHRRSLIDTIGLWRDPVTLQIPTDCDLVLRAVRAGAVFAPTNELSVFKFNAAWRRDAYGRKQADDQRAMLARIESGQDFRQRELVELVRAFVSHRTTEVRMPTESEGYGDMVRAIRTYKGVRRDTTPIEPLVIPRRFWSHTEQLPSFEWYAPEGVDAERMIRWSGPSDRSALQFPIAIPAGTEIRVDVVGLVRPGLLDTLRLSMHGRPVEHTIEAKSDGTHVLRVCSDQPTPSGVPFSIEFQVAGTTPLPRDADRRPRGLAIRALDFVPPDCPPESAKLPALPPMRPPEPEPSSRPEPPVQQPQGRFSAWTRYFKR